MVDNPLPGADCVARLRLLADPTRLAIVRLLTAGPMAVKEINAQIGLEQNLLSHHLKVLREGGLLASARQGKSVVYCLARGVYDPSRGERIDLGCCSICFETAHNGRTG
ncbi:MAG: ArsR family transcriptional regulator [Alphaproteobacteria bacterium]|nr:MAG: ArsR family transcriptional regulator [Alphaproteobacteria bacterium]